MEIRAFTICFSKQKARKQRNYEMELIKIVQRLKCDLDSNDSEQTREDYNRMVKVLDKLSMQKTRGACLRSKAKWCQWGERSSKYFLNPEKRNYTSLCINTLEKEDGTTTSDQDEILNEQARFYESLYTSQNPNVEDPNFKAFFDNDCIPKLNQEQKQKCEGDLKLQECFDALKCFSKNKFPGTDGLTAEFYNCF